MKNDYRVRRKGRYYEILTENDRKNTIHPSANYEKTHLALVGVAHSKEECTELIAKIIAQKANRKYI